MEIGKINKLMVKRTRDYGVYLDGGTSGDILLPKRFVHKEYRPGDTVEVFVYVNREDRLRATTTKPYATVGQFARLRVAAITPSGAFVDWGLQKDLLVPKSQQQDKMEEGKSYIVYVFLDEKTRRITGSTKLDKFLSRQPPAYEEGQEVDLLVFEKTELGYVALINNSHLGMLYKNEVFQQLNIGRSLKGYIKKVRPDLKIDLSLQQPGHQRFDDDSRMVLDKIKELGGKIAVTDKSSPDDIYSLFAISKKAFKKAVGALYKRRLITMDDRGIKLSKPLGKRPPIHYGTATATKEKGARSEEKRRIKAVKKVVT